MQSKENKKKKRNTMRKLLALICLAFVAYAQAQTTTSSSTTSSPGTTSDTTSSTSNRSGTVTDYTPGAAIVLDPGTGQPVHFIIGKSVEIVTPDGKVIKAADVKKNAKVRVHLVADGDRTVVDQITVDDAK
jgi:hypothetical protein